MAFLGGFLLRSAAGAAALALLLACGRGGSKESGSPETAAPERSAREHLSQGRFAEAADAYGRLLKGSPGDARLLAARGMALLGLERIEDALADLDAAVKAAPALEAELKPKVAEAYLRRARRRLSKGETGPARGDLEVLLRLEPGSSTAYAELGYAAILEGRYGECLKPLNQALSLDPRSYAALTSRGSCLAGLDRKQEALKDFDRAVSLEPRSAPAYAGRASVLYQLYDLPAALRDARRAVELEPRFAPSMQILIDEIRSRGLE